jgi:hypothetical protein
MPIPASALSNTGGHHSGCIAYHMHKQDRMSHRGASLNYKYGPEYMVIRAWNL